MKRRRSEADECQRCWPKRRRTGFRRHLLDFSDEILLKVLGFLTTQELTTADRTCRRIHSLASDSEVWKSKYYSKWLSTRMTKASRNLSIQSTTTSTSEKVIRWITHGQALREDAAVDWKRQYKIRSNWDRGAAKSQDLEIARPPTPPVLARVYKGLVFTVDLESGVRVWRQKRLSKRLHAHARLNPAGHPMSLAIDGDSSRINIVIGFSDGHFTLYQLIDGSSLVFLLKQKIGTETAITSIATAGLHVLTMSDDRRISLYHLSTAQNEGAVQKVTSLYAQSTPNVSSLGLRTVGNTIVATVCYAFYELNIGWCIGLQEIRLRAESGDIGRGPMSIPSEHKCEEVDQQGLLSRSAFSASVGSPFALLPEIRSVPTSLSYSHPYLLASLKDNTIMSYTVVSDDQRLEISSGRRLWGHTSAVSRAEVSNRGKAVSMSAKGPEIHLWELEEILCPSGQRRPHIPVIPPYTRLSGSSEREDGLGLAVHELNKELAFTRKWIGFDDEQVIVLGERDDQRQIMTCYDFT